jgi:hypothetical protein
VDDRHGPSAGRDHAEEAAVIAGKQRDELVAAARILEQARRDPSVVDYPALQSAIESAAPTLHHLGWVHKYFSVARAGGAG